MPDPGRPSGVRERPAGHGHLVAALLSGLVLAVGVVLLSAGTASAQDAPQPTQPASTNAPANAPANTPTNTGSDSGITVTFGGSQASGTPDHSGGPLVVLLAVGSVVIVLTGALVLYRSVLDNRPES